MARIETCELAGAALDWAVAKAEGNEEYLDPEKFFPRRYWFNYSTNWDKGGPIIEREKINLTTIHDWTREGWQAYLDSGMSNDYRCGPTPLIAAMRCYVASKLGDVEVPDVLLD